MDSKPLDFTLKSIIEAIYKEDDGINSKVTENFMRALNKSMEKDIPKEEETKETQSGPKKK